MQGFGELPVLLLQDVNIYALVESTACVLAAAEVHSLKHSVGGTASTSHMTGC